MQETEEFQPNMVIETKETISYLGYPVYPKSIRVKKKKFKYTHKTLVIISIRTGNTFKLVHCEAKLVLQLTGSSDLHLIKLALQMCVEKKQLLVKESWD